MLYTGSAPRVRPAAALFRPRRGPEGALGVVAGIGGEDTAPLLVGQRSCERGDHRHGSGSQPCTGCQAHPLALRQSAIKGAHGLDNPPSHPYRPLCIVFMGLRIAKIDQEPVPQVLGNMSVQALDNRSTGRLIGPQYLAEFLRIEL